MDNSSNNRDELIVSILEKVSDKVDIVTVEQARQGVILSNNTVVLEEHARRSTASEARIEHLERHVIFINAAVKVIGALGAVTLFCVKLYSYLIH